MSNPQVLAMLRLDAAWPKDDSTAWCSAFVNYMAWLLRLPRSKSLAARSWLKVGVPVTPLDARAGFDVAILKRGDGEQPGPDVLDAPGHVAFFAGFDVPRASILLLGGNQGDQVSVAGFPLSSLLGIRRLA